MKENILNIQFQYHPNVEMKPNIHKILKMDYLPLLAFKRTAIYSSIMMNNNSDKCKNNRIFQLRNKRH